MLVFFIHGVNTRKSDYADILIKKIRAELVKSNPKYPANFYASFWGNSFNNKKDETVSLIEKDFLRATNQHPEYKLLRRDIYRYQKQRKQVIGNFLGDFLIYQNPRRGREIRKVISSQINQFFEDHSTANDVHFIAHSLGSLILWDLLFSNDLEEDDPAFSFRDRLRRKNIASITTLGSPLLFLKQMLDIDFSIVNKWLDVKASKDFPYLMRWVNIIHSSDLVAYPLAAAIEKELDPKVFFCDQYIWLDANIAEAALHLTSGQSDSAMVIGAESAHSSYFKDIKDGSITARLIAYNLLGKVDLLAKRCVNPK